MLENVPGIGWLTGIAVVLPGAMSYWRGRSLARLADDPALPERLAAAQQRSSLTFIASVAIVLATAPGSSIWAVPLTYVGWLTGGYPLRKKLFEDTWTLGGYLLFCGRFTVAAWGFFFLFLTTPIIAGAARPFEWLAGGALAIVLLVWNARYAEAFRWLMRARPIADPALVGRFTAMAQASSAQLPRFEVVPLDGGAVANAIAMPSRRQPSVIFTETLLTRLDRDEIAAICAHELAHLEHFNPRYLKRIDIVNHALIAAALILTIVPRFLGWDSSLLPTAIWVVLVVIAMAWRARDRQKNETASDLRAIALCGDAEALARGLIKLHVFARLPRRMGGEVERHATHPSLARRIQDIRSAAGSPPAALGEAAVFAAATGAASVTFLQDRLQWKESELATHTLGYGYLSELRLSTTTKQGPVLLAVERGGRKWELALVPADVARLQAVLDVIDTQLGPPAAAQSIWPNLGRFVVAMATLMAGTLGQFAMAVIAFVALLVPSAPVLAGAGVAAFVTAFVSVRLPPWEMLDLGYTLAILFGLIGGVLLAAAWARRAEPLPARTHAAVAVLGGCTALAVAMFLASGLHPVALHQSARQTPSAAVFLLATSAALACGSRRLARGTALAGALAGIFVAVAGTETFLDRLGDDPLLGPSAPIAWKAIEAPATSEVSLPFAATGIRISPGGRSLILTAGRYEEDGEAWDHFVGRLGGPFTKVEADEVIFVDDNRVLAVASAKNTTEIFTVDVDAPGTVAWSTRGPEVGGAVLSYRAETGRWRVLGWTDAGQVVRLEGVPGSPAVEEMRWTRAKSSTPLHAIAAAGGVALFVETSYRSPLTEYPDLWRWALLFETMRSESTFTRVTATARTALGVTRFGAHCVGTALNDDRLVCTAFDGTRTRFAAVDPAAGRLNALAWLPGRFAATATGADGWVSGWLNSRPIAIRLETREALEMAPTRDYVSHIAANDHLVATLTHGGYGSKLKTYDRP